MSRWLVEVSGERFDTEELPFWFPDGDIFAIDEDRHIYLTGPALDACTSAEEALKTAELHFQGLAAIISILTPNFVKPELGGVVRIDDEGRRHFTLFAATGHIRARAKAHALMSVGDAEPKETQAQIFLRKTREHPHLMEALTLWSDGVLSWPRLFRILEEIEMHLGGPVDAVGFCPRSERQRFTRTANTAEVAGKDARHAGKKFAIPKNPMSARDAKIFIHLLLQKALHRL